MPGIIRRDSAWSKLQELLDSEGAGGLKLLSGVLLPIIDFMEVLEDVQLISATKQATATGGLFYDDTDLEVPVDERWSLLHLDAVKVAGTGTVTQLYLKRNTGALYTILKEVGATASVQFTPGVRIVLPTGFFPGVYVNAVTTSVDFRIELLVGKIKLGS